jgi:hypothetical protein
MKSETRRQVAASIFGGVLGLGLGVGGSGMSRLGAGQKTPN